MDPNRKSITQLLNDPSAGGRNEKLYPMVYDNLHEIAGKLFNRERAGHTLQPTLLVNEAYMNLVDQEQIDWKGRSHFFAVGAQAIRRILVHHARSRNAQKRGSGAYKLDLEEGLSVAQEDDGLILEMDEALEQLAMVHERQAKVVEQKFFGGMKMQEIAEDLGVSIKTIEIDWKVAKAWLKKYFSREN